ncbi:nuclear pore complex protein Nup93-like [Xenia sp. Carnegie-2017]|uniref:nuclear pore complex protein Nup93-like n=1 Tax=Xenia sp. Carnegie-2017 TaxID=2897299 RepID=UPI001F0464FA|nr:nuclear pore complex protein Nup93-like [Xenia sp. Carnegie-2017]
MSGFSDLLQQAEQLTADIESGGELPRIERNLHQLAEAGDRLWKKTTGGAGDDADVRASILLGSKGFDLPKLSEKLDNLSTANTFEPLEPIRDADIQGFLRNERENAILAAIEESKKNTFDEAERNHWRCMEQDWEQEKLKILNSLLGSDQDSLDFSTEIMDGAFNRVDLSQRSGLDFIEMAYARQIYMHNEAVLQGMDFDLVDGFHNTASKFDDQHIKDCWMLVDQMTDLNATISSTSSAERSRFSVDSQGFFIQRARSFLEKRYQKYIERTVYNNLQQAQLGGVPGVFFLVKSFLKIRPMVAISHELEDGEVEGVPLWPFIYYCIRCGDLDAAIQVAEISPHHTSKLKEYLQDYMRNEDKRLHPSLEEELRLQYRRSVNNGSDPFKRAVYTVLGHISDAEELSDVITKTDDYLWLKLCHIVSSSETRDHSPGTLTLQNLQMLLLEEYGESYFKASDNPLLYFQVLMLSAQFEAAVEFLSRIEAYRSHAIHFAIVMYLRNLLILSETVQAPLLTKDLSDLGIRKINFARLIKSYTRKFEITDPREALQYFYLLRKLRSPGGENLFNKCVSELVLETREFELLLGHVDVDGTRKFGCIEKFQGDIEDIINVVAKDTEEKGLFEEAARLYDLAKNHEKTVEVLNKLLSQVVSTAPTPNSNRDRLKTLAFNVAERYKSQGNNASRMTLNTFYLLCDLIQFFDLYHQNLTDEAFEVMKKLQLVPLSGASVDQKVSSFRQYTDEIRRCLPDILIATMTILYNKYKERRPDYPSSPATLGREGGLQTFRKNIRQQARALITFAGLLPYRMPGDTSARLVQLEVLMN